MGRSWTRRRRPSTRSGAPRSPTSPLLQGSGAEQNSLKSPEESGSMEETTNRSAREQDQGKGKTEALIGRREGAASSLVPCEGVSRRARPGEAAQQRRCAGSRERREAVEIYWERNETKRRVVFGWLGTGQVYMHISPRDCMVFTGFTV